MAAELADCKYCSERDSKKGEGLHKMHQKR
jgi:hypothetical protein